MKKSLLPLLITVFSFSFLYWQGTGSEAFAQKYDSLNMSLLSHWDDTTTAAELFYHIRYNSVWGWINPKDNKEYAIIGSTAGTYFIEVTDPTKPVVRDFVPGRRDSCIWREYKNYKQYLYTVSDDGVSATEKNSLQIIDMSGLPNSVQVVYDQDTLIVRSHTVFIDGTKMYCGYVHYTPSKYYTMAVYSLANPVAPKFLQALDSDYVLPGGSIVHDMYVRNDTVYASCGNSGLYIFKLSASNHFSLIASLTDYKSFGQGYNHSSALTANGKTLIFADEVPPNLAVKSLDVSDLNNSLTIVDTFRSTPTTGATPHNPFIREGNNARVIVAYYQDGVQIFDITNPAKVVRTGFFDTAPTNCPTCPNPNYSGCWGTYVDLPSGIILASDMQDGLFVLDAKAAMGVPVIPNDVSVDVYPNPFTNYFQLNFSLKAGEKFSCELFDITGKLVMKKPLNVPSGKTSFTMYTNSLSTGTYMLNLKSENISLTKKIIKTTK